jgi:hypothetical protein
MAQATLLDFMGAHGELADMVRVRETSGCTHAQGIHRGGAERHAPEM